MSIKKRFENLRRQSRRRSSRPKTFSSEETAIAYAKANGIEKYTLKNLKSAASKTKKIRIEVA